ncbi:chaperone DnaJ [Sphaceloma murrayae]|uniref:Chaperone DnaJ n=1 Tax=Sphaceloma murrayae TaxID=2082308 RepID=A0A2K1QKD8_9PEZI|nr:chaperone DnaJ [Sphaceloma murrayae]
MTKLNKLTTAPAPPPGPKSDFRKRLTRILRPHRFVPYDPPSPDPVDDRPLPTNLPALDAEVNTIASELAANDIDEARITELILEITRIRDDFKAWAADMDAKIMVMGLEVKSIREAEGYLAWYDRKVMVERREKLERARLDMAKGYHKPTVADEEAEEKLLFLGGGC